MTKTELMETYTAEQLAERVVEMENVSKLRITKCEVSEDKKLIKGKCDKCGEEFILSLDNKYILCTKAELYATQEANRQLNKNVSELQSEVEKYRKAFEDAKKERDCQIAEYQKKIEELADEKEFLETRLKLLKSERDDLIEEVEELQNAQNFSNLEPIGVANIIINAEGTRENLFGRITGKGAMETYRIFDISELRQIAEHLLVYCNHNGEAEE